MALALMAKRKRLAAQREEDAKNANLAPCPLCGSDVKARCHVEGDWHHAEYWTVECPGCRAFFTCYVQAAVPSSPAMSRTSTPLRAGGTSVRAARKEKLDDA